MTSSAPSLGSLVTRTIILAYREDTTPLENALRAEGLNPVVQRRTYTPSEQTYSRTIRCLLNHADAWRAAADHNGYALILEADFVPCRRFASLPAPFDPARHGPLAWAFLYAGGPRFLHLLPGGFIQGHAACPVAILLSPGVARHLVDFAEELVRTTSDLTTYSLWDTIFQWHMMGMGATCFMPYRHYGEHGGIPNPEHNVSGAGRFANHHAECLQGPLAFLPAYARGSRAIYVRTRLLAKLVGLARVITRRVVDPNQPMPANERFHAYVMAFRRLLSFY